MEKKTSVGFKVPYGICTQTQAVIRPDDAHGAKSYRCPVCSSPLTLRKGAQRRTHFAHKPDSLCSLESIEHKVAKLLIQRALKDHREGGDDKAIELLLLCEECSQWKRVPFPSSRIGLVQLEQSLPSGRVGDVVVFSPSSPQKPVLNVEIRYTHAVDDSKAKELTVPWLELSARQAIESTRHWKPINFRLKWTSCAACKRRAQEAQKRKEKREARQAKRMSEIPILPKWEHVPRIAKRWKLEWCADSFWVDPVVCWKCTAPILVFRWEGWQEWSSVTPPTRLRPRTLARRATGAGATRYWVNTCPACKASQGDAFLKATIASFRERFMPPYRSKRKRS